MSYKSGPANLNSAVSGNDWYQAEAGSKLLKAQELGIALIDEDALLAMLG